MAKQRKYSLEFKDETVKFVINQGYSYSQAVKQIGVSTVSIREWVLKFNGNLKNPSVSVFTPEAIELAKLRKEMKVLKEENEILKKTAAFFAKESL